jgi:hypothetical protein
MFQLCGGRCFNTNAKLHIYGVDEGTRVQTKIKEGKVSGVAMV